MIFFRKPVSTFRDHALSKINALKLHCPTWRKGWAKDTPRLFLAVIFCVGRSVSVNCSATFAPAEFRNVQRSALHDAAYICGRSALSNASSLLFPGYSRFIVSGCRCFGAFGGNHEEPWFLAGHTRSLFGHRCRLDLLRGVAALWIDRASCGAIQCAKPSAGPRGAPRSKLPRKRRPCAYVPSC
jgi:hypothetical protein